MNNKWDLRYGELCRVISLWSKDPSTKVGAVVVRNNKSVAATGFNGFPPGVEDKEEWYNCRDTKLSLVVHAEHNALNFCSHENITGGTIYVYPLQPCLACAERIVKRGITRVVTVTNKEKNEYMNDPDVRERYKFHLVDEMFDKLNIKHEIIVINA